MNIRTARQALRSLEASRDLTAETRVASRWVRAALAAEYDLMLRLQILEGAAGVPVDSWWKRGRAILPRVKAFFEKAEVLPAWFAERSVAVYNVLNRALAGALRSYHVNLESFDVLNNSLMGIPLDPSRDEQILRQPYQAGKFLAKKIKDGEETPESVARGVLSNMLKRKVVNLSRHNLEQLSEDEEGRVRDVSERPEGWGADDETSSGEYLSKVIFHAGGDPLGKLIRSFMRKVWTRDPKLGRAQYMTYWLNAFEANHPVDMIDVANEFGITPQSFYSRHWIPAWRDFFEALWRNPELMRKINQRLQAEHLQPLPKELPQSIINVILPPRKRVARSVSDPTDRVVLRFLSTLKKFS